MIEKTYEYESNLQGISGRVLVLYKDSPDTKMAKENDIIVSYFEPEECVYAGWYVTFVGKNGELNRWDGPQGETAEEAIATLRETGVLVRGEGN